MYTGMEDQIREKLRARVKRIAGQIAGVTSRETVEAPMIWPARLRMGEIVRDI